MGNIRNKETGKYNWSTIVLALILTGVLLWQGVFAMLGDAEYVYIPNSDQASEAATEAVEVKPVAMERLSGSNDLGAIWREAVENPTASGGVWDRFWTNASGAITSGSGGGGIGGGGSGSGDSSIFVGESFTHCLVDDVILPPFPVVGARFFCSNNIWWRVIGREGNYRLIMTEGAYNSGNWASRQTSLIQWATVNLAPELRAAIRTPINAGFDTDSISSPGSVPSPNTAATQNAAVFILSEAELDTLIHPVPSLQSTLHALERPAAVVHLRPGRHVRTYFNSLQPMSSGMLQSWWLRSNTVGRNFHTRVETHAFSALVRPTLWISAEDVTLGAETFGAGAETFGANNDLGAMWRSAVDNPAADGGVWGQFWTEASSAITSGGGAHVLRNEGNVRSSRLSSVHLLGDGGGYVTHHPLDALVLPPYPYVGSRFFCSRGIWWRVINADVTGNYRLIITEGAYRSSISDGWIFRQSSLTTWAENNLAPELRVAIRTPENANFNDNTVSTPGAVPYPNTEANQNTAVFILSESEVIQGVFSSIGRERPVALENFSQEDDFLTHFNSGQRLSGGTAHPWWLRAYSSRRSVTEGGGSTTANISSARLRPALWIAV